MKNRLRPTSLTSLYLVIASLICLCAIFGCQLNQTGSESLSRQSQPSSSGVQVFDVDSLLASRQNYGLPLENIFNLDAINGFRSLKLGTQFDALSFNQYWSLSPSHIHDYRHAVNSSYMPGDLKFNDFEITRVDLHFLGDTLAQIELFLGLYEPYTPKPGEDALNILLKPFSPKEAEIKHLNSVLRSAFGPPTQKPSVESYVQEEIITSSASSSKKCSQTQRRTLTTWEARKVMLTLRNEHGADTDCVVSNGGVWLTFQYKNTADRLRNLHNSLIEFYQEQKIKEFSRKIMNDF